VSNLGVSPSTGAATASIPENDEYVEGALHASLAGSVIAFPVVVGQSIAVGEVVAILSAMKVRNIAPLYRYAYFSGKTH
jgi:biotin carboxyl carrier protein